VKEIYIVATQSPKPVSLADLEGSFDSDDVEFLTDVEGCLFSVRAESTRIDVHFETRKENLGWSPDLLSGTELSHEALRKSRGFYRISFEPGKPQASIAVFEALWCIRSLLEHVEGIVIDVTAFKIHTPEDIEELTELEFDIRDHITLHAVELAKNDAPYWVHTHGMGKFAIFDVEVFNLPEDDLQPAETFFHELCTDLAFGQGPAARAVVSTSVGQQFMLLPSDEARQNLYGSTPEMFRGHDAQYCTVVSGEGRHTLSEMLSQYRDRFEKETAEETAAFLQQVKDLLPAFKARFLRKGLMEPLTFLVRAPFEVHPTGSADEALDEEQLWVEVVSWEDETLIGKLVDGGQLTTEWRKGAHVEIEDNQVNAISLSRDGEALEDDAMKALLLAERPM
jgi:hypothetical protein